MKRIILIDNVNNLSGAPMVCKEIAAALNIKIFTQRESTLPVYSSSSYGWKSDSAFMYPFAVLFLLFKLTFIIEFIKSDTIICNTSLTWFYCFLGFIFKKKVVLVLHESSKKNILYSFSIPFSIKLSSLIVTPSKNAYMELNIPKDRWHVLHNKLDDNYLDYNVAVNTFSSKIDILFIDGERDYKGGRLFSDVREHFDLSILNGGELYSTKDERFIEKFNFCGRLTPDIYSKFSIVLILTDNAYWKETFGLVGCEAASCGAIPLFTDSFAYPEIWSLYEGSLHIKEYSYTGVIKRIESILSTSDPSSLLPLKLKKHVNLICGKDLFIHKWLEILT